LGTTIINENHIYGEIKSRLNLGKDHSVRNVVKNLNIVYKTVKFYAVSYDYKTWCLSLRNGHKLRMVENRVLGRSYGPKTGNKKREKKME
jgi:hypothetical protein